MFTGAVIGFAWAVMLLPLHAAAWGTPDHSANPGHVWVEPAGMAATHQVTHLPCGDIAVWGAGLAGRNGTYKVFSWPPTGAKQVVYSGSWSFDPLHATQVIATINGTQLLANAANAGAVPSKTQGYHFKLEVLGTRGMVWKVDEEAAKAGGDATSKGGDLKSKTDGEKNTADEDVQKVGDDVDSQSQRDEDQDEGDATDHPHGSQKSKTFWVNCAAPGGGGGTGSIEIFKANANQPTQGLAGARFVAIDETSGKSITMDYTDVRGFVTNFVPAGTYTVHEAIAPAGFNPAADVTGVKVSDGKITDLTVLDTPSPVTHLSSLTVYKVDPMNHPLAGATFALTSLDKGTSAGANQTTDSTGHATFAGVVPGKYTLHEVSAPAGFSPANDIVVDVTNAPAQQFVMDGFASGQGSLELLKVDATNPTMGLKGARFVATNEQTGVAYTLDYTNSHGFVTNFVPAGTYRVHEAIAPIGFLPAADLTGVPVLAGQTTDRTILDTPGGTGGLSSLTVFKADPTGAPLAGATFTLSDLETGAKVGGTQTTDATGHATFDGVPPFKYTLHEVSAPAGFSAAPDIIVDVTNLPAQQFVRDAFAPGNGSLELFKANAANPTQGLKGARFVATNEQTGKAYTMDYTNGAGFVTNTVPAGTYTLHESVPPVGFLPAADLTGVMVLTGQTTDRTILDSAGTGPTAGHTSSLTVFKSDAAGAPLAGATFQLVDLDSGAAVGTPQTSDSTGHLTFTDVVPGKYTLTETKAPAGFTAAAGQIVDVGLDPAQQGVVDQPAIHHSQAL
jgi:uncharacterized surface anchored protein